MLCMDTKTFSIPDENLARLMERVEKLSRKAVKLVGQPIVLTVVSVKDVERTQTSWIGGVAHQVGTGVFDRYHEVTVDGPRPKFAGWSLVANLEHLKAEGEEITIVRAVPGASVPEEYRNSSAQVCDHCQTRRNRTNTFVLVHDDGSYKKVGRQCIADFLGHMAPADLVRMFEYLAEATEAAEEGEGMGGCGIPKFFNTKEYLAWVVANMRCDGWLSRTNANNAGRYGQATADQAGGCMVEHMMGKAIKPEYKPTEADYKRVDAAFEFMTTFLAGAELNDYLHNLSVVLKLNVIGSKLMGIAASLIPTAEREMGKEIERRVWANLKETSQYLGVVGGKLFVHATVANTRELESAYGVTTMVKFVTPEGSAVTWFASGNKTEEFPIGLKLILAGTVKKHEDYQGLRQTLLTRCCVVTEEIVAAETAKAFKKLARAAKKTQKQLDSAAAAL